MLVVEKAISFGRGCWASVLNLGLGGCVGCVFQRPLSICGRFCFL